MSQVKLKYSVDGKVGKKWGKIIKLGWINFKNLFPEDIDAILSFAQPKIREENGQKELSLSTDRPSNFENKDTATILKILEYLQSTGRYSMPSVENIMTDLKYAYKDAVTTDDMKAATKTTDELWIEFIKRLEDPEMQSIMKSISPYYMGDSIYGWKLALENAMRVKKEMPEATFLKTRHQWNIHYHRNVLPNAQRLLIKIPRDYDKYSKEDVMQQAGYNSRTQYKDLSRGQKDYVDVKMRSGDAEHYTWIGVYDVSQTVLQEGEEDIFNTTAGFKNNLTGELNDKAIQDKMANGEFANPEDVNKIYHNENGNVRQIVDALSRGIQNVYPDIKFYLPKANASDEDFLRSFKDMIMKLADRLIEDKSKIVKQENRQEGIKATLIAVSILTRLNAREVAVSLSTEEFVPRYYYEIREIVNNIISLINKNLPKQENIIRMNETQIPYLDSTEELMDMLNVNQENMQMKQEQFDTKEKQIADIKENFYKQLNKLNKMW